jgi:hypothetical protein
MEVTVVEDHRDAVTWEGERTMQYALLIYGDQSQAENASPEETKQVMDEWWKYEAWLGEKGIKRAGEALQPTTQATTVRVKDGETVTTDGPFAETKEQLGGFYLLECADLDEALEAAAKCPGSWFGTVEVRPVVHFDEIEAPQ